MSEYDEEELKKEIEKKKGKDVTIYNVPEEVWSDFVSMAKLHYDNEGWRVLKDALESLKEDKTSRVDRVEEKVDVLASTINQLAEEMYEDEEGGDKPENDVPQTFGN